MCEWYIFGSVDIFLDGLVTSGLITHDTCVDVDIIEPQRTVFHITSFNVDIFWIDHSVRLQALRSRLIIKMVFARESLVTFDCLLKVELDL